MTVPTSWLQVWQLSATWELKLGPPPLFSPTTTAWRLTWIRLDVQVSTHNKTFWNIFKARYFTVRSVSVSQPLIHIQHSPLAFFIVFWTFSIYFQTSLPWLTSIRMTWSLTKAASTTRSLRSTWVRWVHSVIRLTSITCIYRISFQEITHIVNANCLSVPGSWSPISTGPSLLTWPTQCLRLVLWLKRTAGPWRSKWVSISTSGHTVSLTLP